jgi:hypothetical protein
VGGRFNISEHVDTEPPECHSDAVARPVRRPGHHGSRPAGDGDRDRVARHDPAGRCTAFTATAGVDAETGGGGSVTFTVAADGVTRKTTST